MGVACCHECRCPGRKRVPSGPDGSHLRQDDAQIGAGGVRWVGVLSRTQRYRRSTTCAMTSLAATGAHHPTGPLTAAPSTIPRHTTTSSHAAVPTSSPPSWASAPASRASETRFVVPRPPITLTVATQQWSFLRDTRPGPCEFGGRIDASQIRHVSEDQRAHPGCVPGGHFLARAARARVRRADALLERFSHVAPGPTSGDHLSAGRRASSGSRRRSGLQIPLGPARGTTKHRDATRTKCITSANSWNQRHFLQFPVHLVEMQCTLHGRVRGTLHD